MRPGRTLAILLLIWIVALAVTPVLGPRILGFDELKSDEVAATIFWSLRLPRALLALLAGGTLAIAGLALQSLFRNPLAEPYTLGIASGAALGAVLSLQLESFGWTVSFPALAIASFIGAMLVSLAILGLAMSGYGRDVSTLLLAGIAISLSCSALILFVQYLADMTKTFRMVRWMMGGLAVVGYDEVLWLLPWALAGLGVLLLLRWDLNLLLTGEELAASRGVDLKRLRFGVLGTASAMVAAMVAVTGPIGFVGLIVPHILRRWIGQDHLFLIPACFLGGGAFLAFCDLGSRTIMAPAELPVGVLTALLGGPFFLWLLSRNRPVG
ncbi:MAG: iron ABC transporter permease [Acidobacteriota bacterium]